MGDRSCGCIAIGLGGDGFLLASRYLGHWVSLVLHYFISFSTVLSRHLIVVVSAKRKRGKWGSFILGFSFLGLLGSFPPAPPTYNLVTGFGCCSMCKEGNGAPEIHLFLGFM